MPAVNDSSSRRWLVLGVGMIGLVSGCAAQYGLAYLIPALRASELRLDAATTLVIAPVFGVIVALIAWGAIADRYGERAVLTVGLLGEGAALLGAAAVSDDLARWLLLFVSGASGAAIHAASGRLILGWFDAGQRGLAMGIRQMGQPLGVAAAAVILPPLATGGIGLALDALAMACLASAVLIGLAIRDPARHERSEQHPDHAHSPYRTAYLWRIHAASSLLVVPQYAVAVFAFDYLVNALGWSIGAAGALLGVTQLVGASTRLLAGAWSDRVGSRLGPMRITAIVIGLAMVSLAALAMAGSSASVVALAVAAVVTLSPNGLAFTAVAERAGPRWAGRALGVQNTFQNLVAAVAATPLAILIGAAGGGAFGYGLAFATVAALPYLAAIAIPARAERAVG